MENKARYLFSIDIPFNEETSRAYSDDPEICAAFAEHLVRKINLILNKEVYISMNRIFRLAEMREQLACPTIFFSELKDWSFDYAEDGNGYVIELMLSNYDFHILPVAKPNYREQKQQHINRLKNHRLHVVKNESEEEPAWDQDGNGQKETSESAEKEET